MPANHPFENGKRDFDLIGGRLLAERHANGTPRALFAEHRSDHAGGLRRTRGARAPGRYAHALEIEGARLVAVASTRAEVAATAAAELGVRGSTYEELFAAEDVDAVILAARSIDHAEHACAALGAGKHLFLEKPGATTVFKDPSTKVVNTVRCPNGATSAVGSSWASRSITSSCRPESVSALSDTPIRYPFAS